MALDDIIKIGVGIVIVIWGGMTGWIMRHSQRLTKVESDTHALHETVARNDTRAEAWMARIEAKLDRLIEARGGRD